MTFSHSGSLLRAGNQPRFCQILSPENSFGKTESAFRLTTLPEYLEGRTLKEKCPFLFQERFHHHHERYVRNIFLWGCRVKRGSGETIHSSLGLSAKYIRTLSNMHRKKTKSHFEAEMGSRRRRDTNAFPPPNPESKRVFHAPRGSSFANTIL